MATSTTVSGYMNGDTLAQSVSTAATVAVGGTRSGANYFTAGSHALTASGAAGTLGYGFAYTGGTLTVTPKALTITATAIGAELNPRICRRANDTPAAAANRLRDNRGCPIADRLYAARADNGYKISGAT